jgi:signal transduction histidine kinase
MQHSDQEILIALIAATILFILLAWFIVVFLFFYNKKKLEHYKELEKQKRLFENEALVSQFEIKEQTFHNISQEIHDNVGQIMLLAKLQLNKALMIQPNVAVEETRDLITKAIADLRDISRSLHSEQIASMDFIDAIERELERIKKTSLLKSNLIVQGQKIAIEASKKLILFRIFQEVLQNIIKHSKSDEVNVTIDFQDDFLILDVRDNGIGFNVAEKIDVNNMEKGAGLLNLYNRSKVLNAILLINSEPNKGTQINITMPLK